ncbi:MAG: hypothetical protein ACK559_36605, partial [bacterium]
MSDVNLLNLGLERSIYSKEQMEDFARFQDSQNTRKAYLAEAAELAYLGRRMGSWPHGLSKRTNSQCCGISANSALPTDRPDGSDCDPG